MSERVIEIEDGIVTRGDADWQCIERAQHSGEMGFRPDDSGGMSLFVASRITNADVEGRPGEIEEIAQAVINGEARIFKRCAVQPTADGLGFHFWSPRNSISVAFVPANDARKWAERHLERSSS